MQLTSIVVCLWVFLPLVLSSLIEMHAQSGWDQEIDLAIAEYSTFFYLLLGCFCCMFWVIVHLYYEAPPNQLCAIWLNLGREYIPIHFRIPPATAVLCHIITKHQWLWKPVPLEAMHAHAITLLHQVSQIMFFGSWAVPSLLHTFVFPSFWYRLILISAVQRMLFWKWSCLFRCFVSNLALFGPCGEPSVFALVKSSLDCRLWQWHVYLLKSVLLLAGSL